MTINDIAGLTPEQQDAVTKLLQSEGDKIRTKYSNELRSVNEELAKFKPIEKSEAEKAMDERLRAIEAREAEIAQKEKSYEVAQKLRNAGLPSELAAYLNLGDDIDATIEKVGVAVNGHFLSNGNKPGNHSKQQAITRQQFRKMSYAERANLLATNPELYKILSN